MPVTDIIEMVAGLLTKITANNDRQHEHLHRSIPPPEGTTGLTQQATSVLAFHGKNVPSITILSYLSRIHKYCPTTYEVFLSLVVYFDRMTEVVNNGALRDYHNGTDKFDDGGSPRSARSNGVHSMDNPLVVSIDEEDLVDSDDESPSPPIPSPLRSEQDAFNLSQFFIVDSFNIHRLVIAGVTCASKFFSDVFYTNSRYAKVGDVFPTPVYSLTPFQQVGGLPLIELNHLELQFLLLNDFRLSVPVEELEAYGTMLVEFYASEVLAQQQQGSYSHVPNHLSEDLYMQTSTRSQDSGTSR
jgi:PHO85 cyclin-6/7